MSKRRRRAQRRGAKQNNVRKNIRLGLRHNSKAARYTHTPRCSHCGGEATRARLSDVFPALPPAQDCNIWQCVPCEAHVRCHPPSRMNGHNAWGAMGNPIDAKGRAARGRLHVALDVVWREAPTGTMRKQLRRAVYRWVQDELRLPKRHAHIGLLSRAQCDYMLRIIDIIGADKLRAKLARSLH